MNLGAILRSANAASVDAPAARAELARYGSTPNPAVTDRGPLVAAARSVSLEGMLCSALLGFGLQTATPLQRAIARVIEGRPVGDLWSDEVDHAMGDVRAIGRPKEIGLLMAIRGAKSLLAACTAVYASQHCDLTGLGPGEIPRVSVVSLTRDLANVVRGHIVGQCLASRALSPLIVGTPTASGLVLEHPSGTPVEIRVVAGSRAGASLAARWSAGAIFDEAPKMLGQDDGVVNLDDARANVIGRLLPGAQILWMGSPWAPYGPVYEMVQQHHRKPTDRLVVVRAKGPQLNPGLWTPEACAKMKRTDPDAYQTDVEAEFLAPEQDLFTESEIRNATRDGAADEPPDDLQHYVAGMDPATRGNSWTLVVLTRAKGKRYVALARQWTGSRSAPLSPREVLREMAAILRTYKIDTVDSDAWSGDAIREIADEFKLTVRTTTWSQAENTKAFMRMRSDMLEGTLRLAPVPELIADVQRIRKRTTQSGIAIELPRTSDGRHCDFAPALAKAANAYVGDRETGELQRFEDRVLEQRENARTKEWWDDA